MSKTIFTFIVVILSQYLFSQVDTLWTKAIGGSADEVIGWTMPNNLGSPAVSVDVTSDGNFVITTTSKSSNGYVSTNYGEEDVWVVKINELGDTLWTKVYGGSGYERVYRVRALSDGGCLIVGRTSSNDFHFVGNKGGNDGFLIKLASDGTEIFKKLYGGTEDDFLYDVIVDSNGDYVLCGETGSNDGDLAATGQGLSWVLKVNSTNGNAIWSKTFLGPDSNSPDYLDNFYKIIESSNQDGYILAGYTTPSFADINADNIFYSKISYSGSVIWSKKVGSQNGGDGVGAIIDGGDGKFYIAGKLAGGQGQDVSSGYYGGNGDVWLLKFNALGEKLWDKKYGGSNFEFAFDLIRNSDGHLYITGFTRSSDHDASGQSFGMMDYWLIKTDENGDTLYTKRFGGSSNDVAMGIAKNQSGKILMVGRTLSNDSYIWHNNGGQDVWLVMLSENSPANMSNFQNVSELPIIFPNPAKDKVSIKGIEDILSVKIYDSRGQLVYKTINNEINGLQLAKGFFMIVIESKHGIFGRKLIIQ
jgi:hypothetical protein